MAKRRENTQPYLDHDTLTQREQAKHLGVKVETVKNLGHDSTVDKLTEHPAPHVENYDSADTARTFRDPPRLQGVYRKCNDPRSGIASEQNIDAWAQRARANSYHGGHGEGKDPTMRDPRDGSGLIGPGAEGKSDGYLESTKNWAS